MKDRDRFDTVHAARSAASGGASLPVEVLHGVEQAFDITVARGLWAVGDLAGRRVQPPGSAAPSPARSARRSAASSSDCATTTTVTVADGEIGEIVIRGENVMKGYWNRPDATAEAIRGRLVSLRRPGSSGRRGLLLHRRPQEGHDHPQAATTCIPERSRRFCTRTRRWQRQPSSACRMRRAARRSRRW